MLIAHFDPVAFHAGFRSAEHALFLGEVRAGFALGARTTVRALVAIETVVALIAFTRGAFFKDFALGLFEQQRHAAAGHLGERRGDFHGWNIVFALVVFDQRGEEFEFASRQGLGDLILEAGNAHIVHSLNRRQFERRDRLARGALNHLEQIAFARGDKQDGFAAAAPVRPMRWT